MSNPLANLHDPRLPNHAILQYSKGIMVSILSVKLVKGDGWFSLHWRGVSSGHSKVAIICKWLGGGNSVVLGVTEEGGLGGSKKVVNASVFIVLVVGLGV